MNTDSLSFGDDRFNATPLAQASLLRLLQLSSASLPVGGYAFSQGMEFAIDAGWLKKPTDVADWVRLQLHEAIARVDLPILRYCMQMGEISHKEENVRIAELNALALACRESNELRLTDTAMGEALSRLLTSLDVPHPFTRQDDISFVCLFALAAKYWLIPYDQAALGFAWSWLENQIAAATKLVPLGQTQAQQLLSELQADIPVALALANTLKEADIGSGLPTLAIASALHEEQYSRLFRS